MDITPDQTLQGRLRLLWADLDLIESALEAGAVPPEEINRGQLVEYMRRVASKLKAAQADAEARRLGIMPLAAE